MGNRGGHSYLQTFVLVPLSSHTAAKPRQERCSIGSQTRPRAEPAGTSRATPTGPLNATNQPQRLPELSSRHFWDAPCVSARPLGSFAVDEETGPHGHAFVTGSSKDRAGLPGARVGRSGCGSGRVRFKPGADPGRSGHLLSVQRVICLGSGRLCAFRRSTGVTPWWVPGWEMRIGRRCLTNSSVPQPECSPRPQAGSGRHLSIGDWAVRGCEDCAWLRCGRGHATACSLRRSSDVASGRLHRTDAARLLRRRPVHGRDRRNRSRVDASAWHGWGQQRVGPD